MINTTDYIKYKTYRNIYQRFKNLALNLFEWEGFPDNKGVGVDTEYLEETLHENGLMAFVDDEKLGFIVLKANGTNQNIYGKATDYILTGVNYNKRYNIDDIVLIKNNKLLTSTFDVLREYAEKITDVQLTIDILINSHKSPYILIGDRKTILSLKTAFKKIKNNEPLIIVDNGLNIDNLKTILTETPYIIDKLSDYKNTLYNEVMAFLGIDNMGVDKKERVIVDEVNANNDFINQNIDIMLSSRKKAAIEISKKTGYNITVKLKNEKVRSIYESKNIGVLDDE